MILYLMLGLCLANQLKLTGNPQSLYIIIKIKTESVELTNNLTIKIQ